MATNTPRQVLGRWGNSLGVRLPAAIARQAHLEDKQTVELTVVDEGVLIRPVAQRPSLAERLAAYTPMPGEPVETMAWSAVGAEILELNPQE
ncbi:MAG: AbrB/MazE/SpoVT family DNA-binding domain-containing protein [Cyanobacteriota bacterium]|jgi:antitoxin MazE|nr:AbrB/MazE/SpoVT family DNA-binding domain-containing protein [Synechococcus sp. FGCU3]MEB3104592.1 AbrB/MazE/SpoVT family DNA-binding domain-containing protein [Cyanobacteriota bacterium]